MNISLSKSTLTSLRQNALYPLQTFFATHNNEFTHRNKRKINWLLFTGRRDFTQIKSFPYLVLWICFIEYDFKSRMKHFISIEGLSLVYWLSKITAILLLWSQEST